jgi:protocatechuate 3,4-dioxygenase beta subunit
MALSRRDLLAKCISLGVVTAATNLLPGQLAHAWELSEALPRPSTPVADLGPFYKKDAPRQRELRSASDPGLPLSVSGVVFDTRGDKIPGATVEIWQTDHSGHYDLAGYRYRAALVADSEAKYAFDSVMPGHYPARVCQHIHYLVRAAGHKPLITQLYFATDPAFDGDPDKNYTRDPLITSRELVRHVSLAGDPGSVRANVQFEVVLERL